MVIADNSAAHGLGGFFCNFSTVQRFFRFCNCCKSQINENLPIENFILSTKEVYKNNSLSIELDPNYFYLYALKVAHIYIHLISFMSLQDFDPI